MAAGKSEAVLECIDSYANKQFLHTINRKKGLLLERLVKRHKPMLALETGTLVGYSAIRIARNLPRGGHLISIEISKRRAAQAVRNIADAGLAGNTRVVVGEAFEVISATWHPVDFVFFDVADYLACLEMLEGNSCILRGCVVVANNVKWFQSRLQPYLDHVRHSGKYKSSFHDFGFDGMEISIRK